MPKSKIVIDNLLTRLFTLAQDASGARRDRRFSSWAKIVASVNRKKKGGYSFVGDWINEGTVEIDNKPTVFLVCFAHGSRKYTTREFVVVTYVPSSSEEQSPTLSATGIMTDDSVAGWDLRIRDDVEALLEFGPSEVPESIPFDLGDRKIQKRAVEALLELKKRQPEHSCGEIVARALQAYLGE